MAVTYSPAIRNFERHYAAIRCTLLAESVGVYQKLTVLRLALSLWALMKAYLKCVAASPWVGNSVRSRAALHKWHNVLSEQLLSQIFRQNHHASRCAALQFPTDNQHHDTKLLKSQSVKISDHYVSRSRCRMYLDHLYSIYIYVAFAQNMSGAPYAYHAWSIEHMCMYSKHSTCISRRMKTMPTYV